MSAAPQPASAAGPPDVDKSAGRLRAAARRPAGARPPYRGDAAHSAATGGAISALLTINNIEVIYDHVILVLKGVSLAVPQGGIVALLGANGAGKTTTLKAISNLLRAERGEVTKGTIEYRGE